MPQLQEWLTDIPNGSCFLAEAYLPGNEGSKNVTGILGCLKDKAVARQKATPLHFYIFDIMAWDNCNFMNKPYLERANFVENELPKYSSQFVEFAKFYEGKELWSKIQEYLGNGREGVVIMRKDAKVYQKRTPARVSIKIKKELRDTIDVFFTGRASAPTRLYTGKEIETWTYWINSVTLERLPVGEHYAEMRFQGYPYEAVTKNYYNHYAGSLEIGVMRDGKVYPVGWLSNLTEEIKENYKDYKGKCIEVSAMQFDDETHALRHGKMIGFRPDLIPEDCTYENIWEYNE